MKGKEHTGREQQRYKGWPNPHGIYRNGHLAGLDEASPEEVPLDPEQFERMLEMGLLVQRGIEVYG
jgi:hypothetical protein